MLCKCGCNQIANTEKQFISGHNLRVIIKSEEHKIKIGVAQKRAWKVKRERLPLGSKNKDVNGYVRVKVAVGSGRWISEHILVMEAHLGRKLRKGEGVHHINGIRDDNRIKNLYLCKNKSEHKRIEDSCKLLVLSMFIKGEVIFNGESKCYELATT